MSHKINNIRKIIEAIMILILIVLSSVILYKHSEAKTQNKIYHNSIRVAGFYNTAYHTKMNVGIINKVMESAIKYNKEFFPNGPYTYKDIIAIAIIESEFSQFLVGGSGEKGIFQILSPTEEFTELKMKHANIFDIDTNTKVAYHVLKKKFNKHKDYYMGIIAYNGVRKLSDNTVSKVYWKRFEEARNVVDILID